VYILHSLALINYLYGYRTSSLTNFVFKCKMFYLLLCNYISLRHKWVRSWEKILKDPETFAERNMTGPDQTILARFCILFIFVSLKVLDLEIISSGKLQFLFIFNCHILESLSSKLRFFIRKAFFDSLQMFFPPRIEIK